VDAVPGDQHVVRPAREQLLGLAVEAQARH
jgi:hypothetical protein